jgi:hypothetical protein
MRPARLAPAMISTLGHRVPRRRQRGAPPGPGAIRPGSRKSGSQRSRRRRETIRTLDPPSTVSSLHAGGRDTTHSANDRICHQGRTPNCGGRRDSLITAETSLIARFNSLQGHKKFPVRMRTELARKKLISCPFSLPPRRRRGPNR